MKKTTTTTSPNFKAWGIRGHRMVHVTREQARRFKKAWALRGPISPVEVVFRKAA